MSRPYPPHAYSDAPRARCYWPTTVHALRFAPLHGDARADVAVLGGGVTGLSAALHLAEAGVSVALLEERQIGWGASGRNGGFCCLGGAKAGDADLAHAFGPEAPAAWRATERAAIGTVEAAIARLGLDVDRHSLGETLLAHSPRAWDRLRREAETIPASYGVTPTLIPRGEMAAEGMAGPFHGALTLPLGFGLNPLKYLTGLARGAAALGVAIHEDTAVTALTPEGAGWRLVTPGGALTARQVIVATNGYSSDHLPPWLAARFLPAQSAVLVTRPLPDDEAAAQGWTTGQMAYTTRTFLHYFRRMPCGRMLFGMRGSLLSGSAADTRAEARLRANFAALFPVFARAEAPHVWSGLVSLSRDLRPFCGQVPRAPGLWAALNYHGNGVAMGSHCGAILADRIAHGAPRRAAPDFLAAPPPRFPGGGLRRHLLWPAYGWRMLTDL